MMLTENGFPVHSIEECKRMVGNGFIELVRCAVPEGQRSNEEISMYLSRLRAVYEQHWGYGMYVYHGIEELLEYLQTHQISFAIDTNKDEGVAKKIAAHFFPRFTFSGFQEPPADA